jgi:hypothetical protein
MTTEGTASLCVLHSAWYEVQPSSPGSRLAVRTLRNSPPHSHGTAWKVPYIVRLHDNSQKCHHHHEHNYCQQCKWVYAVFNHLKSKLVQIIFNNSVRTAKKTLHFTITKIYWLTLFKEIIAVYSENHTKLIYTKCIVTDNKSGWDIQLPLGFKGLIDRLL